VSLLAIGIADQAAARHRAKHSSSSSATSVNSAGKGDKSADKAATLGDKPTGGKKTAKGKSKDDKSASKKDAAPQIPLTPGPAPETSEANVALVKSALEALRKHGASKATGIAEGISDPSARKLVEWLILRSEHNGADSRRYLTFIAANPGWPSLLQFRRRAEVMLWVENVKPAQAVSFFKDMPPQSGTGRLVLARALLAQGDRDGAAALVREAWRDFPLSTEIEKQVVERYSELLTRADHQARVEKRLCAGENEAALRTAQRLGKAEHAIAQARIALAKKGGNAKKLLEGVPAEARQEPGYILAQVQSLRHADKIADATKLLLSAPHDLAEVHDGEGWWVERRILARKLLDRGDAQSAYLAVADAAEPTKENSRVERLFMAGWIALRYLDDPATAATHFAQIQSVSSHPTSLSRSHYWLGRVAEALHQPAQARAEYQAAAEASASYYGQLARARLGLDALALAPAPPTPNKEAEAERLEVVRALEILYALNERPLAIALMSGLGEGVDDIGALSAVGELAEQRNDARGMLQLGKAALARGLPLDYYAFPTVGVPGYSPIGPGIDKAMLFAIIRQESAFDPSDWSAAHAMGLMQVTPEAGRDTCKRFGCSYDVKRLKNDSPYNLQIGAAELGGVMQDYRGNYALAFAAYNAGRGRVQEWIAAFGDPRDPKVDPIDWVERIPFQETRNYVQRVMENMQVYRTRFGENAPLTIGTDLRRDASAK
jgi:soluble lytic murein transglycosylase